MDEKFSWMKEHHYLSFRLVQFHTGLGIIAYLGAVWPGWLVALDIWHKP